MHKSFRFFEKTKVCNIISLLEKALLTYNILKSLIHQEGDHGKENIPCRS